MKKTIIWRESIYHNNFTCKCGKQLMKDEEILDDVLYDESRKELVCPNCYLVVGKETTLEMAQKIHAMRDGVA